MPTNELIALVGAVVFAATVGMCIGLGVGKVLGKLFSRGAAGAPNTPLEERHEERVNEEAKQRTQQLQQRTLRLHAEVIIRDPPTAEEFDKWMNLTGADGGGAADAEDEDDSPDSE